MLKISRLCRRTRKIPLPAELISSNVEFLRAEAIADAKDRRAIRFGRRSTNICDQISSSGMVRLILSKTMTDDDLSRYVQQLQGRYRSAAGATAYANYSKGVPANALSDRKAMDAELRTLLNRLRLVYCVTAMRDQKLSTIRNIFGGVIGVITLFFLVRHMMLPTFQKLMGALSVGVDDSYPISNCLEIALLGLAGAATSIVRRAGKIVRADPLQDDPVVQVSALEKGLESLIVAALCGPIFALLMLMIFMSGAVTMPGLTPTFGRDGTYPHCSQFELFKQCVAFTNDPTNAPKMGLWAFVAGFAEQLVPDVLNRFTKKTEIA